MPDNVQEEILNIRVNFDPSATRKVQQFQSQLTQTFGSGQIQNSVRSATKEVKEFEDALGKLARQGLGITRTFTDLAKVFTPLPVAIAFIGYELLKQIGVMGEWAQKMTEVGNTARMAGMRIGDFTNISNQLRQAGISAQSASGMISSFSRAYAQLMLQPQKRAEFFAMAGPEFAEGMDNALAKLGTFTTNVDKLNYIRHMGLNVYANEFARTHDKMLATYKEEMFLQAFGLEQLINKTEDFTQQDEKHLALQKEMAEKAAILNTQIEIERQKREEIFNLSMGWAVDFEAKIVHIGTILEDAIIDQLEQLKEGKWTPWASPEHPASVAPGLQPGKAPADWSRVTRPPGVGGAVPFMSADVGSGSEHMTVRERRVRAHVQPGTPGTAAGPWTGAPEDKPFWWDWTRSTNVEDRRGEVKEEQTQTIDTNTKEFHDLNARLQRLLDTGIFGKGSTAPAGVVPLAEGGIVSGPTNALVGEKGPEAIIGKGGMSIVDQPTRTVLGKDGTQAVVPLTSAGADIDKTIAGFAKSESGERSIMRHDYAATVVENLAGLRNYNAADHERLKKFFATGGEGMAAADEAWCAHTVRTAYRMAGLGGSLAGTTAAANSFNDWQKEVKPEDVQRGDVLTLPGIKNFRTGHVGLASGPYDPKTHTIPFAAGNTAIPGEGWHKGGAAAITNLPVGGTGSDRLLSARRDVPRIELHSPGPAPSSRLAMMAEGGIAFGESFGASVMPQYPSRAGIGSAVSDTLKEYKSAYDNLAKIASESGGARTSSGLVSHSPGQLFRGAMALLGAGSTAVTAPLHATVGKQASELLGVKQETANLPIDVTQSLLSGPGLLAGAPKVAQYAHTAFDVGKSIYQYAEGQRGPNKLASLAGADDIKARAELDRANIPGGGTTQGTITIDHHEPDSPKAFRKGPLLRPTKLNRQSSMVDAAHSPAPTGAQ